MTYRHQKDALVFMSDREIGRLTDTMTYWRSGTDENGTLMYVYHSKVFRSQFLTCSDIVTH